MQPGDECYFVHDEAGRVLAIIQRASQRSDGVEIGVRPEPLAGQKVVEGRLPDQAADLNELLETGDLRIDLATGQIIASPSREGSG